MVQVIEQTHEEKVEMYMKSTKKELIGMLIECNRIVEKMPITIEAVPFRCDSTTGNTVFTTTSTKL